MADFPEQVEIKIAYIGGGSTLWAKHLMSDLALCPHLTGHVALYDIDRAAAEHNVKVGDALFSHRDARTKFKVSAPKTVAGALKGADFVVLSLEPGPVQLRYADLAIPEKYGIIQTVGDTTGPGGLVRALRTIPIKAWYAHKVMEYCPEAWVINYTNPMTLSTAAMYAAEPGIKAFGCCHEVFGTQRMLARRVKKAFGASVDREDIKLDIAGLNHFTFASSATWDGNDLFPVLREYCSRRGFFGDKTGNALRRKKTSAVFDCDSLIAFDFFRNFGVLGAACDRHLAEFVPWYLTTEKELHRWGVVLTPFSCRKEWARRPRPKPADILKQPLRPSGEEGVDQMLALVGVGMLDTNVNLPNEGQMSELPTGAVVETNARFRRDSLKPIVAEPLPDGVNALVARVVNVQEMTLEAAIEKDTQWAFEALLNDPLVNISPDKAWKMFMEMLRYTKRMLPGWRVK